MEKVIVPFSDQSRPYDTKYVYQFEEYEMFELLPLMEKQINKRINALRKKVDYYEGLKETSADEKQLDKLFNYTEMLDFFEGAAKFIDKIKNKAL